MMNNFTSKLCGLIFVALTFTCLGGYSFASTTPVKDVDAPARKPFQTASFEFTAPAGRVTTYPLVTVPAGKRLVIEETSGYCFNMTYSFAGLESTNLQERQMGFQFLPAGFVSTTPASASVRLYANPGENVHIYVLNGGGTDGTCLMAVSGYYVNLP